MPLNGAKQAFFGSVALVLGNRSSVHWQIPVEKTCEYLDRIREFQRTSFASEPLGLPDPAGLYISGAEPFTQIDDLEKLLDCAAHNKMMVEVVSSVSWADSDATTDAVLRRLARKMQLLTILTGREEVDRHGLVALERLLLATRRFNMSFQLHVGVGLGQPFPKELLSLEVLNCDTSVIRVEPVSGGQADKNGSRWPQGYLLDTPPRYARCAELMGFVIVPGGDVYPCSSSIGFTQFRIGNMETQTVQEILQSATANAELQKLRSEGPFFLYQSMRDSKQAGALPRGFVSSCDFHRWILANALSTEKPVDNLSRRCTRSTVSEVKAALRPSATPRPPREN
jgi:Iron-sulfur cluster-binding domain